MNGPVASLELRYERDIVMVRQRARQVAAMVGFDHQDQTRISTAVSEIARNAFSYGGGGIVEFSIEGRTPPQVLVIRVQDKGPGIADLQSILDGHYRSPSGMGVGIVGARRLVDQFEIAAEPGQGTKVLLKKLLPRGLAALDPIDVSRMAEEVAHIQPRDAVEEVQRQNQELLRVLAELTRRQDELERLNRELDDTNRGVLALYSELDEKADHLRRADEIKTRFISNMSHEFRTPVNSIQALAGLLIGRVDGDLNPEQERQVTYIRKAADALSELVNDLLDLAKVEAGKTVVRPIEFPVSGLFGTLRGMLRPLLVNDSVRLVFEDARGLPPLHTDEGKVSQILRNFISNALKFTERGEVRIGARLGVSERTVRFNVADTGIGIAPEHQESVFEEFTQIDNPMQARFRGTGLGLPLCRKLAALLGGHVSVESALGVGSTFQVEIPIVYENKQETITPEWDPQSDLLPVLMIEDTAELILLYEKYLTAGPFGVVAARTLREARSALASIRPAAIVLDILLVGEDTWGLLTELKRSEATRDIPVLVLTTVEDRAKAITLGADAYLAKPIDRSTLLRTLVRLTSPRSVRRILIVDDDEIFRYVVRQSLHQTPHTIYEASGGWEGLRLAEKEVPDLVFLDLAMPDLSGAQVLARLESNPHTRGIPVVVLTGNRLDADARASLRCARSVMHKDEVSADRMRDVIERTLGLEEATS